MFIKGRTMKQNIILLVICLAVTGLMILLDCTVVQKSTERKGSLTVDPDRNPKWAQPLQKPGLSNFYKVSDALYRSAQPTAEGMKSLKEMGIRTVVNLRSFHSDRDEIGETGLAYEHIYVKAWHAEDKEVVRFLQIVSDPNRQPLLVHCLHGSDRTGTMCAFYRIAIQGWSKEDAVKEMVNGGYGFHGMWQNLLEYIEKADIDDLKKRAGL
jgi:protein tyrosine/serine phosphatase